MSERLNELRKLCEESIVEWNKAFKANDAAAMNRIEETLRDQEGDYAKQSANELYQRCKETGAPIIAAVRAYSYPILKHRVEREDGVITGMVIVDDREKQIDLIKLCEYCELPTMWKYKVEKMGMLLALRAAKELGLTPAEMKQVEKTYKMDRLAREIEMGKTPDSNNQICKVMQIAIDAIIYEDNGKDKNKYAANSHDVAYMLMCHTRRGKGQLAVTVAKASFLHSLVVDVLHRIVCGKKYGLEYQLMKDDAKDSEPAPKKTEKSTEVSAPKAKQTKVVEEPTEVVVIEPERKSADA